MKKRRQMLSVFDYFRGDLYFKWVESTLFSEHWFKIKEKTEIPLLYEMRALHRVPKVIKAGIKDEDCD